MRYRIVGINYNPINISILIPSRRIKDSVCIAIRKTFSFGHPTLFFN